MMPLCRGFPVDGKIEQHVIGEDFVVAREADMFVELPLGLIALYWIRMFKPLVERGLPQLPGEKMGFVTDAFTALTEIAAFELRPGASFADVTGEALRRALAHAAQLIARMPATHLTFANDQPVFPTTYGRSRHTSFGVPLVLRRDPGSAHSVACPAADGGVDRTHVGFGMGATYPGFCRAARKDRDCR